MNKTFFIALFISIFVITLNNIPVILGYAAQQDSLVYLGRRDINSQDVYTYVAFIEQARQGHILFQNLYMSEPQSDSLIRPSYLLIGSMARLTGLTSIAAYHVSRIVFSLLFCFVLFQFVGIFFKKSRDRLISFTVVLLSAGVGGLIGSFAPNTTDLWIPESITFLSLAEAPHFILSQTLMLLGFMAYFSGVEKRKIYYYLISAGLFCLLSFEHPFNLFVTGVTIAVMTGYLLVTKYEERKSLLIGAALIVGVSILGVLYQYFETVSNPILKSWAQESLLISPSPYNFIYGYGLILVFACFGIEKVLREKKFTSLFLVAWVVITIILLYSPIPFQRRFSEGLHIPLAILASYGLIIVANYVSKFTLEKARQVAFFLVVGFSIGVMSITPLERMVNDLQVIFQDTTQGYYQHLLPGEIGAMNYLKDKTTTKDVILANWFYGNILPGLTGRKVYVGHKVQTPFFSHKIDLINTFLLNKNSNQANKFLKDNGITYIFLGRNDTMLQYGFKPDTKPYLIKIFDKNDVTIYKVR